MRLATKVKHWKLYHFLTHQIIFTHCLYYCLGGAFIYESPDISNIRQVSLLIFLYKSFDLIYIQNMWRCFIKRYNNIFGGFKIFKQFQFQTFLHKRDIKLIYSLGQWYFFYCVVKRCFQTIFNLFWEHQNMIISASVTEHREGCSQVLIVGIGVMVRQNCLFLDIMIRTTIYRHLVWQ